MDVEKGIVAVSIQLIAPTNRDIAAAVKVAEHLEAVGFHSINCPYK